MGPLVTIYMPLYNAKRFIERSIESVNRQTYENIEVILINDGSYDGTAELVDQKYSRLENFRIYHQENKGLNYTNNVALRLSNGKYITRLDPDDVLFDDAIECLVDVLENDPEAGLVYPDYYLVDENENIISRIINEPIEKRAIHDRAPHGACTLFRAKVLKQLGGYYDCFRCQDGYDIWIKFIMNHKPRNINKPLFKYTRHDSNITNDNKKIIKTRYDIQRKFYDENFKTIKKVLGVIPVVSAPMRSTVKPFNDLNGKPLIWYTLQEALKSKRIDRFIVTTDTEEIANYVRSFGFEAIVREEECCGKLVKMTDIISSVLNSVQHDLDYDMVCILYINSPLRKSAYIDAAVDIFNIFGADSVVGVDEIVNPIYKSSVYGLELINDHEHPVKYEDDAFYIDNSSVYVSGVEHFKKTGEIIGGKIGRVVIPCHDGLKIESEDDFNVASAALKFRSEKER